MRRRDLIRWIAAATGWPLVGAERAAALVDGNRPDLHEYSAGEVALLDELAETILPRTDSPGAKDARVGAFIARYSAACYDDAQRQSLRTGLADVDVQSRKAFGAEFMQASGEQKQQLLIGMDAEAKRQARDHRDGPPHWFTLLKQLTLYGFFTSEPGATQVLRYRPIPGPYKGVVPYRKGDASWS